MADEQLRRLLALLRIPHLGPVKIGKILENYPDLTSLFNQHGKFLLDSGDEDREPDWQGVEEDLTWGLGARRHILSLKDKDYPALLKQIHVPPPVLFIYGQLECLNKPQLAIVGSRNPTFHGIKLAREFSEHLSCVGLCITSGLALGIDAAAHRGALLGGGGTVAVLGSGLDRIYPVQHQGLVEEIAAKGAVVSEFPINTAPHFSNFPRRNRLISGLSIGCLVVEAALKSGSLITAKYSLDQGREVFAIPGSIHNPLSKGCHQLLRQGAKLVEKAQDILEELGSLLNYTVDFPENKASKLTHLSRTSRGQKGSLLKKMNEGACTSIDDLVQQGELTVEKVSSMLLELELEGKVRSVPGGYLRV